MKYKLLGHSGLKVSEICLGTMTFGTEFGWGSSKEESEKVFRTYAEKGGNFLDTANYYTKGTSETFLGEFIKTQRERFVIGTKYTLNTNPADPNAGGNHRKNMRQAVDASLKRLRTDYIDIYWVHAWDTMTPIEEVMRGLDDLVRMGKILYIGISDMPAWLVSRGNTLAEWRGWTPFAALQLQYSLIERTIEREFFPMAEELDLAITAWSPLGGGLLAGKYSQQNDAKPSNARYTVNPTWGQRFLTERNHSIANAVQALAKEIGRTPSQVAIRWTMQKNKRVIPIIGAKKEGQLEENLASLDFSLTDEQMQRLDDASKIDLGFPYDFLQLKNMKELVHGAAFESIEKRL